MTRVAGGIARNVDPRPGDGARQLPLRARPRARARPRRGCASCARPRRRSRSLGNAPSAPGRRPSDRSCSASSRPATCAVAPEAGLDAGRGVRRAGPRRGQLRPGRARAGAPPRRAGRDRRARAGVRDALERVRAREALPVLAGLRHVPVRAPRTRRRPRLAARGVDVDRLRRRRAARGDARVHPRGARRRRSSRCRATRGGRACRSCARRSPAGLRRRFGVDARPGHRDRPDARLQGGDLPPRAGRRSAGRRDVAVHRRPRYPVYERGALFAGARGRSSCRCASERRLPARPRRGRRGTWARSRPVAELPEQPDRPRPRRSRSTSAPRRSRASTASSLASDEALLGAVVRRRAAGVGAAGRATARTCVVFNTLSKRSSMPGYRSGFVAGDPELVAALKRYRPNVGAAPPEFVQRAAVAAWGDEEHVEEVRDRYRAKRDVLLPRCSRPRAAPRGRRRDVLPLARGRRRRRGVAARLLERGDRRRARLVSSAPPARATCGSRWCRRWPSASARSACSDVCCEGYGAAASS